MALIERVGSREVTISRRGMTGRRLFVCDWAERYIINPALGSTYPGDSNLRLVNLNFRPYGRPIGDTQSYTYCEIEAEYQTLTGPEDAPTVTWDFAGEVLEVSGGRTWSDAATAIGQPQNYFEPEVEETLEMSVASIPGAAILACMGKLNNAVWRGYPLGIALFMGGSSRLEWDPDLVNWRARMTYKFLLRTRDHNYAWRSDTRVWDYTIPALYAYADFTTLGLG